MASHSSTVNRDYLVDNLKFILITAVVAGHFIEPYINQSPYFKGIFICIYVFHMPLFVFISGYFSKSENSLAANKIITTLLIPYVIFSSLWYLRDSIHLKTIYLDIFSPPFHLWYLLSLVIWKLLLPVFRNFKHFLLLSIVLALFAGFSQSIDNTISLSRTISLFPFFILGTLCPSDTLHSIHKKKYFAIFGGLLLIAVFYCAFNYRVNWRILFWADSYHAAGYRNSTGFALRFVIMVSAALVSLGIIVLSSTKKRFFTFIGSRTLTVYIFHGFLVRSFAVRFPIWNQSILTNMIIILFPILVIYVLSLPITEKLYLKFIGFFTSETFLRKTVAPKS